MISVYVVQHIRDTDEDNEDVKFIGVFESKRLAEDAVTALKTQPGFRSSPGNFVIDEYVLNKAHWSSGYGAE